ncbi:E3 ubiquitin-protein ligase Rnf220-like isoform X1 [Haliotis asinina]|uniref:E3 ubiquitin-protein ligase Rnf220-like isoform X1 n=2 Tax=Haliotis asinina TaxID=109174 RepID=UPI003531B806
MSNLTDFAMFRFNLWPKPFFTPPPGNAGMENTSFVPNPLTSPALMVLASTAEGHEAARMPSSHPFQGQGLDKDMPTPFNTTAFTMYRPGDPFSPPIYAPLPPFVRSNLDRGVGLISPGGGGAFRPLGPNSSEGVDNYQSAFTPAKKAKLDDSGCHYSSSENCDPNFSESNPDSTSIRDSTPFIVKEERPSSISSAGCDTNSENQSEPGDLYDRGTPDSEGRNLRKQRKRSVLDGQTPCCPVCGITLRAGEVESHLNLELDKLEKLSRGGRKSRDSTPQGRKTLPSPSSCRKGKDSPSPEVASQARFESYLRIRCNRQSRLSARCRNKKKKPSEEGYKETLCPVCNDRLTGNADELNAHVEQCLKKYQTRGDLGEDEPVDVEGDGDQYEEYTWAGQTRVRATTMLQGGFAKSGFQTMNLRRIQDEDIDLNVDGDDSEEYGKPQFSEVDVIPVSADEPGEDRERQALRGALLSSDPSSSHTEGHSNSPECQNKQSHDHNHDVPMEGSSVSTTTGSSTSEVICALRSRLRDLEEEKSERQKCLICMEPYRNALTSIQCWHVHCEMCWLKTLGAKKLCPQCNMITSPSDLRRIYL